ncbi:MAG TPA: protein-disulfide reductase DsbD domain-containing protein [Vicinamibacterales bacterium]|jgi:DsbC/DsbD-like thiol-disulfide interchange protein
MLALFVAAWVAQAAVTSRETPQVVLKTSANVSEVAPGGTVTLQLEVTPRPKLHVYAPGVAGYIPIQLTLAADPALTIAKATYPPGQKYVEPALNETALVYAKPFRITDAVAVARTASGAVTIRGTVRYQACDETICYLPKTVPVEWTVTVK